MEEEVQRDEIEEKVKENLQNFVVRDFDFDYEEDDIENRLDYEFD